MLKKIKGHIQGIYCKSCKILLESELDALKGVNHIKVNHQTGQAQIEYDDDKISQKNIAKRVKELGYEMEHDLPNQKKRKPGHLFRNILISLILIFLFIIAYQLIRDYGLLEIFSILDEQKISYWLILVIGLLAGFHCIGMCGGLVVAYSVNQSSKCHGKYIRHWQYNLGRIISYAVIGAILGGFGSFFAINSIFTGIVTIGAGIFMALLGLSLVTNFKWLEIIKLRTPSFIARYLYNQRYSKSPKGPFVIGLLNGFMPCGPLQAMQLYALASGSIISGALSMGIYGLGTVPLMFGFGSFVTLISQHRIKQIMKVSGIIVIVLGLFMFNRGLINFGYGFRGISASDQIGQSEYMISDDMEYQVINMELSYKGYSPNVLHIRQGIPVRWIINVKQMTGCTDEILLSDYDIRQELTKGENIIEFLPKGTGEIKFSCWMQMVWGKFVIESEDGSINRESADPPEVQYCVINECSN